MDSMFSRRRFISASSFLLTFLRTRPWIDALTKEPDVATLQVSTRVNHPPVPQDFVGLSYEVMQLEDPSFFSASNTGLVEAFRQISTRGVLRMGGNTSEFSWWKPNSTDRPPVRSTAKPNPGEPPPSTLYAITPEAIRNLGSFLKATGWTCIYGLNLGYGTPTVDTAEAVFVARTLGSSLAYFQIGNEVDDFSRHLRDPNTWNAETYLKEWLSIARAVEEAVPDVPFGLPDVATDVTWLPQIAAKLTAIDRKPRLVALSHHHYFGGPPSNPNVDIPHLMRIDPVVAQQAKIAKPAANLLNVALRMTEGNTCYRGGKSDLSDVFASALWAAEYALRLMQLGYGGIHLHGGSGHAVAVSVGGGLVGEKLMQDPTSPHPKPFYTPIANQATTHGSGTDTPLNGVYQVQPVGFGLIFAGAFCGASPLDANLSSGGVLPETVSAYAARQSDGTVLVAIFNKDGENEFRVNLPAYKPMKVLSADSLTSRIARIDTIGNITRTSNASLKNQLTVPPHTSVMLSLV
jgi:hypothetical protein